MENLKEARLKAGITQMELARKIGVSLTTLCKWENGVGKPSKENAEKLAKALKKEQNIENIAFALQEIEKFAESIERGEYEDKPSAVIYNAMQITGYTESIREELRLLKINL
ncbi:MAG: helix-turn-helix domain-containing protein [Alphaproteobacteria bacterium]|nr:helix-turn-helix domain-containing protein [Alphaproteobacteria bacterium]